jgi:hypothetical protein
MMASTPGTSTAERNMGCRGVMTCARDVLVPSLLAPRPLVTTHPYGEASSDPGNNNNNNNNNNKDFIKERKKKHIRQYKKNTI